jgi:sialic acid synthase SpsE
MKVIIEAAKHHEGDMNKAKGIIADVARHGFWAVKFQAYDLDDLNPKHKNYERNKKCHLTLEQLFKLREYAHYHGIKFFCSAFSRSVIKTLSSFTNTIKVPSTFLKWDDFISDCINHFSTVFISTGFHSHSEIDDAFYKHHHDKTVFMHCVSNYPTKGAELNKYPPRMKGLSYHGQDLIPVVMAVAKGWEYLEVHYDTWEKRFGMLQEVISCAKHHLYSNGYPSQEELENYKFFKSEFKGLKKALK